MNAEDIKLNSVNWEHGMLLTPEHFIRQERYLSSLVLWALRYTTNAFGLVGGGSRIPSNEYGAIRYDPVVAVDEDEDAVSISVTQCRALTQSGCVVEITPENPLHRRFPKADLEGVAESRIYVVCDPNKRETVDGPIDSFNPQMRTECTASFRLTLQTYAEEVPYAVAVARLRRTKTGAGYEKDSEFIPACTSMIAFSELTAAWRKIVDQVTALTERYTELHRAMREYANLFKERGIETDMDLEALSFVGRMVVALQNCVYEILDPVHSPRIFFGKLRQFLHSSAVYLDLSPAVQQYFEILKESGETEFIPLLEQQKNILLTPRRWDIHDDLGVDVRAMLQSLAALSRLEQALEGKYIDFRFSSSLEAMSFVFDRGGRVLYRLAARASRVQGDKGEMILFFAQMRLEGRDKYRLILVGEPGASFERGAKLSVEIRINEGTGFKRPPIVLPCESRASTQRNFEFDFDAPEVPVITDVRVSIPAYHPIRTALLFVRHRFYAPVQEQSARAIEHEEKSVSPMEPTPKERALESLPPLQDRGAEGWRQQEKSPLREDPRKSKPTLEPDKQPPPLRRRRLE